MAKGVVGGWERALVQERSSKEMPAACIQIVLAARRNAARKIESISYSGIPGIPPRTRCPEGYDWFTKSHL
jgi:hypothetical protein